ncbi:MAG: PSP1 domain-containing protein [Bacillota bacterium]
MYKVVGVRFKKAGKIYYFDPVDIPLATGDPVIVETARGIEFGNVTVGPKEVDDSEVTQPLKKVLRRATPEDLQTAEENCQREKRAFEIGLEKIANHNLEMKLVDVEYTFDRSKIIFYFTADGRVDFRELVKDLASVFRTRIELRQIGVRDEAKMLGGLGPCGRSLCCATFLGDFEPVSIKMAKEQNLSLNPAKISGICGRLMCCLKYESDCYKQGSGCCKGCGKQLENLPEAEEYIDEDQDFIDPELPED